MARDTEFDRLSANFASAARLQVPDFLPGSVWIAGAGPGDPGLLTLYALHALNSADVVLHDALIAADILSLAACARLEDVGKRAGRARTRQLRINQRLVALAGQGHRVLRLKGGDPFVFGRGGEEALGLAAAGVPFRIVPGISAAMGGAASAGIPLTHRTLARSVVFATGHDVSGALPRTLDFNALAGNDVLVFYMALRHAGEIATRLIAAGRPPEEAVAFIANATTPQERITLTTLSMAGTIAATLNRQCPTLILAGPVVALRELIAPAQDATPVRLQPDPLVAAGAMS